MAEVLITYKAESDSLIAVVKEVVKGNVAIGESATKAGQDASKAYKDAANSAKAAFGSQETSKQLAKLGSESKKVILEIKSTFENVKTSAANTAVSLKEQVTNLNASRAAAVKNNKEAVESIKVVNTYTNAKQEEAQAEKKSAEAKKKSAEETKKNIEATRSLSSELKISKDQLTLLASEGKKNTSEYRELAKSTASLQKSLLTTNKEIKLLSSGSEVFSAAIGAVKGLAAGFAVVQGAAGLFAKDNEELQNAIAKTNSAMAILTGLQEVNNILTGGSAKNLGVLTIAQKGYNFVVGQSTGAMKVFKIALASTGVGLLVVALGYLISSLSDTSEKTKEAADEARDLQKAFNELGRGAQDAFDELNNAKIDLKVQKGGITKFAGERIKTITDTAAEIRNIEQKLADDETAILEEFNEKYKFGSEGREEAFKIVSDRIKKLNETSQNEIEAVEIKRKTAILKIADDENKEKEEKLKKAAEARKKAEEDAKNAREKLLQLELDVFKSSLDEQSKILADSNDQIQELEKTFREAKFKKGSAEEIQAQKDLQNAIEEIKKQATAKNIELEKQAQEKILAAKLEAAKLAEAAVADAELAIRKKVLIETEILQEQGLKTFIDVSNAKIAVLKQEAAIAKASVQNQSDEALKRVEKGSKEEIDIKNNTAKQIELIDATLQQNINTTTQKGIEDTTKLRKEENQKQIDLILEYAMAVGNALMAVNDLQRQLSENRIADINTEKETQLNAINESFDTERSKIRQRAALELRANRAIAAEKTKQAKADKALALFNAIIGTAAAIATAKTLPLKIIAGFIGAAQIAIIASKPIPKFAQGGVVGGQLHSQGGTQIEAEKDEYIVKRSQSVKHRKELDAINTSTQAFRNMINERYVRPAIMNYVLNRKQEQGVTVNASLNSKAMESELRGLRKDIRNSRVRSINTQLDSRYTWQ